MFMLPLPSNFVSGKVHDSTYMIRKDIMLSIAGNLSLWREL